MPFVNVKVAGMPLGQDQILAIQKGITQLMAEVLHKVGPLVGVLVEEVSPKSWSIGAQPVKRAAHVDAIVSAGSNTPEQKSRFVTEANEMLRSVLGSEMDEVCYVVIHDVPKDSWGYDGLTQERRANQHKTS